MNLEFDMVADSVKFEINGRQFKAGGVQLADQWRPLIQFGRSEHVIDIPTFYLRNLTVGNDERTYCFPLNENEGSDVHDINRKITGHVRNPVWLINDAFHWKKADVQYSSRTVAGSNINTGTQEFFYFNEDSITSYNVRTRDVYTRRYANKCPVHMRLGTNFLDEKNNRLYVYEVFDPPGGEVTVACLDLDTMVWTTVSTQTLPTQLHHHSSYFDKKNRRYIIFGGFGNTFYNRNFYMFDLETARWETLSYTGDRITPRYFTSMGYDEKENALYVFGGMGNESGDQAVGRVYYYSLYKMVLGENKVTKLWEIPWRKENVVPVRGMVVADEGAFYALCYPEHFSRSALRLYRFSIADGTYEVLGDSIPIVSEKITTNANLYHNKRTGELFSVVQEFDYDDVGSQAKIYSLSYPPVTMGKLKYYSHPEESGSIWPLVVIIACGVGFLLYMLIPRKDKREKKEDVSAGKVQEPLPPPPPLPPVDGEKEKRANAIYLFGDFSIRNRSNRDITYMMSTKLKHIFLLILQYSLENGITTQELSELLWPNKPEDKVKNSRGVALNNLRKILCELDGISLVHEKGFYKILFTTACYCDYIRCLELISSAGTKPGIDELVPIVSRGKFLKSVDTLLLDSFKEHVERKLEPVLLIDIEKSHKSANHQITVTLCEALFHIDPLNEEALLYLVRSLVSLRMEENARHRYLLFAMEYKNAMGERYGKSFADLREGVV